MQNKIGFFQLDNLITNRVPFMFYNMGPSIRDWYQSVSRHHVESYEQLVTADRILADVAQKKIPKDYAIVLLCANGQVSEKLAQQLAAASYTNVYILEGGHQQMLVDREQM